MERSRNKNIPYPYLDVLALPSPGEITPLRPDTELLIQRLEIEKEQGNNKIVKISFSEKNEIVVTRKGERCTCFDFYYDSAGRIYKRTNGKTTYEFLFDEKGRPEYLIYYEKGKKKDKLIGGEQYLYFSRDDINYDTVFLDNEGEVFAIETAYGRKSKPLYDQGLPI